MTTTDDTDRAPGRPYFDPEGGRHLDARLEVEQLDSWSNDGMKHIAGNGRVLDRVADAARIVDELHRAIAGVGMLYGPGAAAAILAPARSPATTASSSTGSARSTTSSSPRPPTSSPHSRP